MALKNLPVSISNFKSNILNILAQDSIRLFLNDHWTWDSKKYKLCNSFVKSYQNLFTLHCHFWEALQLDILITCILEISKKRSEEVNRAEDEAICLLESII